MGLEATRFSNPSLSKSAAAGGVFTLRLASALKSSLKRNSLESEFRVDFQTLCCFLNHHLLLEKNVLSLIFFGMIKDPLHFSSRQDLNSNLKRISLKKSSIRVGGAYF